MEKTIKVNGIHCGGCEGRAKRAMEALAEEIRSNARQARAYFGG